MHKPILNEIISLTIHGLGSSGEGVGYYEGFTIFVDGALPGETVKVRLVECHKRYGRGQLISVSIPSTDRINPPCQYFGTCGGCQLMHLSYAKQLEEKHKRVVDALKRIGKIEDCEIRPCVPSPSTLTYRNKIQLPVRKGKDGIEIGLFARSSHDLIEIDSCHIHTDIGEQVYKEIRKIIKDSKIEPYDPANQEGELRHLIIKSSLNKQEALVVLVTNQNASPELLAIAEKIIDTCKYVKGVVHNIQQEKNNVILGDKYNVLLGSGFIHETICGLTFKVSPASFFQVNPKQAENLYDKALDFADLKGDETVLDAYCGVGTLSLIFSKHAKNVIGVECVSEAIQDAKENAKMNKIENVSFICNTSEAFINSSKEKFDLVLLNPPRKGCEPSFLDGIRRLAPKKLIYISCDPATLARDLAILKGYNYKIDVVQPFDMFPQTSHVESLVRLTLP